MNERSAPTNDDSDGAGNGSRAPERALFAGFGAGASLIAGSVLAFLALTAFLTFEGLIGGSSQSPDESVFIAQQSQAPESVAANLSAAPEAVSPAPVPGVPSAAPPPTAAPAAPLTAPAPPAPPPVPNVPGAGGDQGPGGEGAAPETPRGPVGSVIDQIDDLLPPNDDTSLGGVLQPITDPLDSTLDKALRGDGLTLQDLLDLLTGTIAGVTPTVGNLKQALLGSGPLLGD